MEQRHKPLTVTHVAKQKGRPTTYLIVINDEIELTVPEPLLIEYRILPGKSVQRDDIERWKYEGEKSIAWHVALELLGRKARTSSELKRLLEEKGYSQEIAEETVSRCEDAGYINDLEYAKNWAERRIVLQNKGRRYVIEELRHKGVNREVIERAIAGVDEQVEYSKAWEAGKKRWERLDGDVRERTRKVGMFLARRGYERAVVNKVIRRLAEHESND